VCLQAHCGDFSFKEFIYFGVDIEGAPSVIISTQFFHSMFVSFKKPFKLGNIASASALRPTGLLKNHTFTADLPSEKQTLAIK
jgi:hypothetical protein